jgi:DNA polymerase-1
VPATDSTTDPSGRPRLLLLDGHSLAYRAFFALPVENFSTTTGQHTNAVYGFTSMLVNVLRDEQPTHAAVAFDVSRQTFRLEEYAEYKAKRNKTPDEFRSQLPLIEKVLTSFGISFLKKDGYEADDIIATLTTQAVAGGMEVLILTGDRDSLQLVSDDATVLYPMRGGGRGEVRRTATPLPRARRDRGRDVRQPAGGARCRPGLRRQVDQPVRRPRQRHHPRRPDHRQEG